MENLSPPVFYLVTVGIAAILLSVLSQVMSLVSGWKKLANLYPASGDADGETFRWRSIDLGWMGYGNCVNLSAGHTGLRLAGAFPIRFGHAPILLPWRELKATAVKGRLMSYVELRAAKAPEVRIKLRRGLAESLLRAGGSAAPKAPALPA